MAFETYYPRIPISREWLNQNSDKNKHLIGYKRYEGYVVQRPDGQIVFETQSMFFGMRKKKILEKQGYIIHEVR